jgi:UDP:flavonoid glycosyltransferase YjiC (YdhE family)
MRILVTSTPGTGHIHPLIPLALALADRGHEIIWATGPSSCRTVEAFGIPTRPAGPDVGPRNQRFASLTDHLAQLPPRDRRIVAMPLMFGTLSAPVMRDALVPLFDELRPDLVLHEVAELAAAPLASIRGIPHVTVAFSDVVTPAVTAAVADSVAAIWLAAGLAPASDSGWFDHLYLHPFPPSMTAPREVAHPTLLACRPRSVGPVGPVGTVGRAEPALERLARLGVDRPLIYVTFGTEMGARAPWHPLLAALAEIDADVLVTLGNPAVAEQLGPVPPNVAVEAWVPQDAVLGRAVLVVSHAGAGTVLAAAAAGVPQLCLPIAADQWDNADALVRAGAGRVLEMDGRSREAIAVAIEEMLAGGWEPAARAVAAEIEAMPDLDEIVPRVEALVAG